MRDARFDHLPLVVGDGANTQLPDYLAILEAAATCASASAPGIYVAERRWTLKTVDGVDVALPEKDPADAVASARGPEREAPLLEKDIVAIDLRIPGRVVAADARRGSARADLLARKSKKKGATT